MKRYLRLFLVNFRYCLLRVLEFRAEVFGWTFSSLFWALLSLFVTNLIFGQVDSIAGWTKNEALVLSVTGSMFNSILWFFVIPSVLDFGEKIRKGDFDFYLLRPVNSQFLISISRFEFDNYLRVFVMILLLYKLVPQAGVFIGPLNILGFILLLGFGLIIYYSFFFMITTLGFWLINMESLEDLFDTAITMGRYPTDIFNGAVRAFFFFIIPMAFVATFPVQVLLGKAGFELVFVGLVTAVIFLFLSGHFWNFALKHYSSASS